MLDDSAPRSAGESRRLGKPCSQACRRPRRRRRRGSDQIPKRRFSSALVTSRVRVLAAGRGAPVGQALLCAQLQPLGVVIRWNDRERIFGGEVVADASLDAGGESDMGLFDAGQGFHVCEASLRAP